MKIPEGYTEKEVLDCIEKIVNQLAGTFSFGYYGRDDIKQEGYFEAIKVLEKEKFDNKRSLANFLYTHIRNRLINLMRDKLKRSDPPCKECHEGNPCGKDGEICSYYKRWFKRNSAKENLVRPVDIEHICIDNEAFIHDESHAEEEVEINEIKKIIDKKLPIEYRAIYLQMQAGVSVPKSKRKEVEKIVLQILNGAIECRNEDD